MPQRDVYHSAVKAALNGACTWPCRPRPMNLRDGKIWIQFDGTAPGVAAEFLEAGVPKDRIVLAFHSPDQRKLTPFAVA